MPARHPELDHAVALSNAGRNAEAVLIINRLAQAGEPGALAMLAEMKWRGGLVPQDLPAARDLFCRAGEAGHANAAAICTNLLASGIAGPRNWIAALKRLKHEARTADNRRAAYDLIRKMALDPDGYPASLPDAVALSETPWVRRVPRLFSAAECDYFRRIADPRYEMSTVNDSQGRQVADPIRTSDGATLHWMIEDPAVHALNRRLAGATATQWEQGEAIQILRYKPGQQYRPHFDFVRASENQRVLTALVWLNDDYEGGETAFLKTGLNVRGRKGDALIFRNALPDRSVDPMSEHAGLPVTRGTKYLASRWIRELRWVP
jgi:prolyl 4-hydroxylase